MRFRAAGAPNRSGWNKRVRSRPAGRPDGASNRDICGKGTGAIQERGNGAWIEPVASASVPARSSSSFSSWPRSCPSSLARWERPRASARNACSICCCERTTTPDCASWAELELAANNAPPSRPIHAKLVARRNRMPVAAAATTVRFPRNHDGAASDSERRTDCRRLRFLVSRGMSLHGVPARQAAPLPVHAQAEPPLMRRGVGAELARIAGKELQAGGRPRDLDGDDRAVASGLRIP